MPIEFLSNQELRLHVYEFFHTITYPNGNMLRCFNPSTLVQHRLAMRVRSRASWSLVSFVGVPATIQREQRAQQFSS